MGWTSPATWTVGQVVGASDLNTQIRDNMNFNFNGKAFYSYRANGAPAYSTTSLTVVDIDATNISAALTIATGRVMVGLLMDAYADVDTNRHLNFVINLDGVDQTWGESLVNLTTKTALVGSVFPLTGLSNASHTIKGRYNGDTGGGTYSLRTVWFWIMEF